MTPLPPSDKPAPGARARFAPPCGALTRPGEVERAAWAAGEGVIVGVDEAGRGPLAGPVTVGAVAFLPETLKMAWCQELDDSKRLSPQARTRCVDLIRTHALAWSVVSLGPGEIDTINILQATKRAMAQAVDQLAAELAALGQPLDRVYLDGNQFIDSPHPQTTVVKGDGRSMHIAAASILAKVSRDRHMAHCHEQWPLYGFDKHKGYGTKAHREAIATYGPCPIHRKTFAGVKEHLPPPAGPLF